LTDFGRNEKGLSLICFHLTTKGMHQKKKKIEQRHSSGEEEKERKLESSGRGRKKKERGGSSLCPSIFPSRVLRWAKKKKTRGPGGRKARGSQKE